MADTERLKELFARALSMRDPAERNAFLAEACQGDPELREQLDSLLHAAEQAGDFSRSNDAVPESRRRPGGPRHA